ncbi:IS30 family transposase [Weissella oryzae]|uniref:IS30 family transposase n=1 Tax=Weissella oryzae TaxID=1129792 RepID=UPI0004883AE8|nr:IS30 family transposase [Weissella oryzae]
MRSYRRLSTRERYLIWTWRYDRKPALSYAEIAKRLGRAKSTIFNEVHYNRMRPDISLQKFPYDPEFADYNAEQKRVLRKRGSVKVKSRQLKRIKKLWYEENYTIPMIAHDVKINLSTGTLYKYLHQGFNALVGYKLRKHRKKTKRFKPVAKQQKADEKRSINTRPKHVASRRQFGHWEMDCVDSRNGVKAALLVLTERKTRFTVVYKVHNKSVEQIVGALKQFKKQYTGSIRSITTDRGSEFTNLSVMYYLESNHISVYYAHPYSPEEKGTIERINRDIRRFFPKGTSFASILPSEIKEVVKTLNNFPREVLKWERPRVLFREAKHQADVRLKMKKAKRLTQTYKLA